MMENCFLHKYIVHGCIKRDGYGFFTYKSRWVILVLQLKMWWDTNNSVVQEKNVEDMYTPDKS